jgi:hypothetical protein
MEASDRFGQDTRLRTVFWARPWCLSPRDALVFRHRILLHLAVLEEPRLFPQPNSNFSTKYMLRLRLRGLKMGEFSRVVGDKGFEPLTSRV